MSDDAKLPDPMEALLSAWPVAHRPELDWEAFADATVTHAFADDHPVADDLLGAPPLEPEEGEPSKPRLAALPSLDDEELSLTDIAKASLEDDDPEEARELAQLAFSHAHRERVSRPSYPDVPRTSEIRATPRPPIPVENPAPQADVVPLESTGRGQRGGGGRWGIAVAVLGIAAAAAMIVFRPSQGSESATAAAPPISIPTETNGGSAKGGAGEQEVAITPQGTVAPPSLTVEELKPEAPSAPRLAVTAAKPAAAAPTPVATQAAPEQEEPDDPRLVPASQAGNVPLEPSTGAALAAVGRVMGGAKACVAGHSGPSNATITFGSDGKVQSVGISGPAAGTAAESCIRSALSGARVAPFAKPTFTVRVPIRP
ncbi:MAG: hypothetical protein H6718_02190 [Polyangiaceae bacterium]|nr:hypothetical protein [Polyangiaceae bacterium]MCB9608665.1 hypothetical protein [Polyangiaceae bacterium]